MNRVKPYGCMVDLFTRLTNARPLARDIDALMPWAYIQTAQLQIASIPVK